MLRPDSSLTGTSAIDIPAPAVTSGHTFSFSQDGESFLLDGERFQIRSGEMHPAPVPAEYWQHRILMARAMGMNCIAL
ncbi:beta-galactosidase, partial [Paraburkholderia sp. SIMBA_027]|uniref:beta-galactosidase n=1 Tax=Paraburkholderia sp. SIMBA_027 TaxID=3085770 RepID=UPI00397C4737